MAVYLSSGTTTVFVCPSITAGTTTTVFACPSITAGTITASQVTSSAIVQPQSNTTWGYVLEPGLQWGWHQGGYSRAQYTETAAQREARAAAVRRNEACRRARVLASERAEALLLGLLDEDQAASYIQRGWFEVTGSAGGRFRVNKRGQAGNVDELPADGGDRIASYCIHPSGGFPDADAHVAQYLALVTDEPEFRRVANRTLRRYAVPQAA